MTTGFKNTIHKLLQALGWFVLFTCLLACMAPYLNPQHFVWITLLGLVFPLLFGAAILACIYFFIKKNRYKWCSILVLIAAIPQMLCVFGMHLFATHSPEKKNGDVRVLTWNISSWGITNRNNTYKTSYRKEITDLINNSNADVVCLQEYFFGWGKGAQDTVIKELQEKGYIYRYFAKTNYTERIYSTALITGVAILSKYPIVDTGHIYFSNENFEDPLVYADIKVADSTIRIYTTHLRSVRFEAYDYETLDNNAAAKASIGKYREVVWKLKHAYKKRALQAVLMQDAIAKSPYPIIVCGDFNDLPGSYTYKKVAANLQDAFLKKGFGFGRTIGFISPTLRIDYILADKKFTIAQYKKYEVDYSDHYPVEADVRFGE
jgi:endonuclease/exonuclease/phosphatase family metal-dependent hydrolase